MRIDAAMGNIKPYGYASGGNRSFRAQTAKSNGRSRDMDLRTRFGSGDDPRMSAQSKKSKKRVPKVGAGLTDNAYYTYNLASKL